MKISEPRVDLFEAASTTHSIKSNLNNTDNSGTVDVLGIRPTLTVGVRVDAIDSIAVICAALTYAIEHRRSLLMTFVNPSTAMAASRDTQLRGMLQRFDIVAPDGIGMVMAMRMLRRAKKPRRVSFDNTSLAPFVFDLATRKHLDIVIVGGAPGIAETAKLQIEKNHPGVRIIGTLSGFGSEDQLTARTRALAPSMVIAGMGTAVQESFLLKLSDNGWQGIGFTCGGYLDQLVLKGEVYYPPWIDRFNLRSAYRLWMEPRRLWRRYLIEYPKFLVQLLKFFVVEEEEEPSDSWPRPRGMIAETISNETSS